jgi:hypothetical protein
MKKQISKVLLLFSTVILFNCQNDDLQKTEPIIENQNEYLIDQISFKEVKENAKAFQKLKEAGTRNASLTGRGVFNDDYGVFIDTTNIMMIEKDGNRSFTFQIINESNDGEIKNLILNSTDGENYKAYIASYLLSPEEWVKISNGEMINDNLPSSVTEFSQFARGGVIGDGADCIDIYTITQLYCKDSGGRIIKDNGDLGSGCVGMSWPVETKIYKIAGDCMSSGGGLYGPGTPSNPGDPTNPNTGGGGGTGSPNNPINNPGTNNPSPPIITTPILLYAIVPFVNGLSAEQKLWWNTATTQLKQDIIKFLQKNQTEEAEDYVKGLIDYANLNNNSSESLQEIKNILDILDDGLIEGQPVVVGPDLPINNMANYLSGFNTTQPATITIYADQPVAGKHNVFSGSNVGHAFISIKQGTKIKTLGFYPQNSASSIAPNPLTPQPNDFVSTPGIFQNDQGHSYDVSITVSITASQLSSTLNGIISVAQSNPSYNIGSMNCSDLAIIIFKSSTNVNIPSCESPRLYWSGQTPATLGQILRTLTLPPGATRNTTGGTAPLNSSN